MVSSKEYAQIFLASVTLMHYIMTMKLKEISNDPGTYMFYCPGCQMFHQVPTAGKDRPNWTFNGSQQKPTFSPSLLIRFPHFDGSKDVNLICHSFVREGMIQYLNDCTHNLKGQTVEIPDIEPHLN